MCPKSTDNDINNKYTYNISVECHIDISHFLTSLENNKTEHFCVQKLKLNQELTT